MTHRADIEWDDAEFERLLQSVERNDRLRSSSRTRLRDQMLEHYHARESDDSGRPELVLAPTGDESVHTDPSATSQRRILGVAAAMLILGALGVFVALAMRETPAGPATPVDRSYTSDVLGTEVSFDRPRELVIVEERDGVLSLAEIGAAEPSVLLTRPQELSSVDLLGNLGDPALAVQYQQRDIAGGRAEVALVSVTAEAAAQRECLAGDPCVLLIDDPPTALRAGTLHEVVVLGQDDLPPIVVVTYGEGEAAGALLSSLVLGEPAPPPT